VVFFGDNAWEKVKNISQSLRLFRDGRFELYNRTGNVHPHGGAAFREAVAEAVSYESAEPLGDAPSVPLTVAAAPKPPPIAAAAAAAAAQPTPRWYSKTSKSSSSSRNDSAQGSVAKAKAGAAESADAAKEALSKAQREIDNLAFGAPGKKAIHSAEQEMTERERRKLARALELSASLTAEDRGASEGPAVQHPAALLPSKSGKAAVGGRRQRFSIAKRFPIRDVVFDLMAPPPPGATIGSDDDDGTNRGSLRQGAPGAVGVNDRQRKLARPKRLKKTGVLFESIRNEKKPL
jgi:hypothetical protein